MGCLLLPAAILLSVMMLLVQSKPVDIRPAQPPRKHHPAKGGSPEARPDSGLAYDNYLRQVVEVLESDPNFRKKLETANISEIKNGDIAMHLEMVNHTVRTALDELKRQEVARLVELARLQMQGGTLKNVKKMEMPGHLDMKNPHSFEMADLKHLILKTTADLEKLDQKRKEEFKEYEMEKEYEKKKHLAELTEEERKREEDRLEALKKKHAEHPKVNHPGSKDQFEEVWDKVDHLEEQDFNPKTFFYKHDLNGDFEWNIEEVDALVQLELDKVYDARNSPEEDDLLEREEEMNRMRSHIFQEMDKDKNYRITFQEFIDYTGPQGDQAEFEKDEGWKTVDEAPTFSEEDYQKFLKSHHGQGTGDKAAEDLKFQSEQNEEPLFARPARPNLDNLQNKGNRHQGEQPHRQRPHFNQREKQGQQPQFSQQENQGQHSQLSQQENQGQQPHFSQQENQGQQPHFSQQENQGQQLHLNEQQSEHDSQKIQQQIKELQDKLSQQEQPSQLP